MKVSAKASWLASAAFKRFQRFLIDFPALFIEEKNPRSVRNLPVDLELQIESALMEDSTVSSCCASMQGS